MNRNSTSNVFWFISFPCFFSYLMMIDSSSATPAAPALYVFGDSILDSGNNNMLPTFAKADYLPYGYDFVKGSTGRYTNGKTVADFLADFLRLPYSPPYLSMRSSGILTGLNYASGSCGILPETGNSFGKCLHLREQVDLFEKTIKLDLQRHFKTSIQLSHYLSKSIIIISVGSNDYINNYLDTILHQTSKVYDPQQFAQLLIDKLYQQLQRLYYLGARKVVMFEIGPVGCIPSITRQHKHNGICVEENNQMVSYFNNRLPAMLKTLTSTLKGSNFVLGHVNWLGYDAIINRSKYGLVDSSNPCCTTWANGTSGCIPLLEPCSDPDRHFFWDAFHLTEAVYSVLASRCINDNSVCIPVNMKQLIQM